MPSMPPLTESQQPTLAPGVRLRTDPLNGQSLLLYPEGVLELEEPAAAILRLCEPPRTVADIITALAEIYEASSGEIAGDVREYLASLTRRGLVILRER